MKYVFRKKNLFFFTIFFLFFFSFSLSSERSLALFLTPDSNVNDRVCETPLVHNVYILFTFFVFLVVIFFVAFFLKEKKEDNFTFTNDLSGEVKNDLPKPISQKEPKN